MARLTARKLKSEVDGYFDGISCPVAVMESVPTGEKDSDGHEIYREVEALNSRGEPVMTEKWLLPPSVPDMLNHLGLTAAEWEEIKADGKLGAIAMAAELRVERYLRRELLTRPNKAIKGVLATLQKDFGFGEAEGRGESGGTLEDLIGGGGA